MRRSGRASIVPVVLAFLCLGSVVHASETVDLPFEVIHESNVSYYKENFQRVFTGEDAFDFVFRVSNSSDGSLTLPAIDFDKEIVLAVFRRFTPYVGKTMMIRKVTLSEQLMTVEVVIKYPGVFCYELVGDVTLNQFIKVPRPSSLVAVEFKIFKSFGKPCQFGVQLPESLEETIRINPSEFKDRVDLNTPIMRPSAE